MTEKNSGTMIRGADGGLYYIPDDKMQSFRLPDQQSADTHKLLDQSGLSPQGNQVPALHGEGLVKQVPGLAQPMCMAPDNDKIKSIVRKK